jgi:hypothetical protein
MRLRLLSVVVGVVMTACGRSQDGIPSFAPMPAPPPPPLRFTLTGTVSESGGGPPLDGVSIRAPVLPNGFQEMTTGANGAFNLTDLPVASYFTFRKPGFEELARALPLDGHPIAVHLQRRIEMSADETLTATLYQDDPFYEYWLGDASCEPCKRIHVTVRQQGPIELELGSASSSLCFWVESPDTGSLLGGGCGSADPKRTYSALAGGLSVIVYSKDPIAAPVTFQINSRLIGSEPTAPSQ